MLWPTSWMRGLFHQFAGFFFSGGVKSHALPSQFQVDNRKIHVNWGLSRMLSSPRSIRKSLQNGNCSIPGYSSSHSLSNPKTMVYHNWSWQGCRTYNMVMLTTTIDLVVLIRLIELANICPGSFVGTSSWGATRLGLHHGMNSKFTLQSPGNVTASCFPVCRNLIHQKMQ